MHNKMIARVRADEGMVIIYVGTLYNFIELLWENYRKVTAVLSPAELWSLVLS
jgi:hypothetical protein